MANERVGNRLRRIRGRLGLSLDEAAKESDIKAGVLAYLERGLNPPSTDQARRLCVVYRIPLAVIEKHEEYYFDNEAGDFRLKSRKVETEQAKSQKEQNMDDIVHTRLLLRFAAVGQEVYNKLYDLTIDKGPDDVEKMNDVVRDVIKYLEDNGYTYTKVK